MTEIISMIRPGTQMSLDFIMLDELRKRTGIEPNRIVLFAVSELVTNSLDKNDATEITVDVYYNPETGFHTVKVGDNGKSGLSREMIGKILEFENKASSKRGIHSVQRGALGNALKSLFGYSYALAKDRGIEPHPVIIESLAKRYTIRIEPDYSAGRINNKIGEDNCDDGNTSLSFDFYTGVDGVMKDRIKDFIGSTHMANPDRKITVNAYGEQITYDPIDSKIVIPERSTSMNWYREKEFISLFQDYRRADQDITLGDFIRLFRGFSGRKKVKEVMEKLQKHPDLNLHSDKNTNLQFFPNMRLSKFPNGYLGLLFMTLKEMSDPIGRRTVPNVLGLVGQPTFQKVADKEGWELKYGNTVGFEIIGENYYTKTGEVPYIIEVAIFYRRGDGEGLKKYNAVNFMTAPGNVFYNFYDVSSHLASCGISDTSDVTVLIHLIIPRTVWLNYSKTELSSGYYGSDNRPISSEFGKLMKSVLPIPKTPKVYEYKPPKPDKAVSWVPSGTLGNEIYEKRLQEFAEEMDQIKGTLPSRISNFSARGWGYYTEGMRKIDKHQFPAIAKAINDCQKIGLLDMDFTADDRDQSRRFDDFYDFIGYSLRDPFSELITDLRGKIDGFIYRASTQGNDFWQGEKYYVMMVVEKVDIYNLFQPITEKYRVPLANGKGWSTLKIRNAIARKAKWAEGKGMIPVLLLFGDHDPVGLAITDQFRKNLNDLSRATGYRADNLIIERFGLNKEDIDKYGLTWIDNLKTSSGKDADETNSIVRKYIAEFGKKKVEANAVLKDKNTIEIMEQLCRDTIEKYQGKDITQRFDAKIKRNRDKVLKRVGGEGAWNHFTEILDDTISEIRKDAKTDDPREIKEAPEKELREASVYADNISACPHCDRDFSYRDVDVGRILICQHCSEKFRLGGVP